MQRVITFLVTLAFGLSLSALPARASDYWSPRTSALGGAGHAGPLLNDSIYLNPAFASFTPAYGIGANYLMFNGGPDNEDGTSSTHGSSLNLSIQDGRSELFQAGAAFTRREDAVLIHFGASKSVIKRLGFGIGGKLVAPNDGSHSRFTDATFSTLFGLAPWLQLAGIVDNMIESEEARDHGFYREYVLGVKLNIMGIMMVYLDPHLTPHLGDTAFGHEVGLEVTPMADVFIRVGNFRNASIPHIFNQRGRGYGFGLGWLGPHLSLDLGVSRTIDPIGTTTWDFGMTVFN